MRTEKEWTIDKKMMLYLGQMNFKNSKPAKGLVLVLFILSAFTFSGFSIQQNPNESIVAKREWVASGNRQIRRVIPIFSEFVKSSAASMIWQSDLYLILHHNQLFSTHLNHNLRTVPLQKMWHFTMLTFSIAEDDTHGRIS